MVFEIDLPNFPDWAVAMARVVPVLRVPSAYSQFDVSINDFTYYLWVKVADLHHKLYVDVSVSATYIDEHSDTQQVPIYLDLDIVIVNENNYFTEQNEGV